jgi:Sec-independent protein translocase protein TatA
MDFLSPPKLLMILVIALIVLGPDKLPSTARRAGALWSDVKRWRAHLESEVRATFPDLPSTTEITRAVRSPIAMLDRLADEHSAATNAPAVDSSITLNESPSTSVSHPARPPSPMASASQAPRDPRVPHVDMVVDPDAASMN